MNRDEAIRRAEIAMAWAWGETVQHQEKSPQKRYDWKDLEPDRDFDVYESPLFFAPNIDWRIKPKPMEYWAFFKEGCNLPCDSAPGWYKQDDLPNKTSGRWVRMVEKQ